MSTFRTGAFISGNCVTTSSADMATLRDNQGGAAVSQDVPPFTVAHNGLNMTRGLNVIGPRRAEFQPRTAARGVAAASGSG